MSLAVLTTARGYMGDSGIISLGSLSLSIEHFFQRDLLLVPSLEANLATMVCPTRRVRFSHVHPIGRYQHSP